MLSKVQRDLRKDVAEPADSKAIEGPDCGHVKQVIRKWRKAASVGQVAGEARAAITSADAAAGRAAAAAGHAREIGTAIGKGGELPEGIKLSAESAEQAAKAATSASTALETELETFKSKTSSSGFSGSAVDDSDMVSLRESTSAAKEAAASAIDASELALKKAEDAQEAATKSSQKVARLVAAILDASDPVLKDAAAAAQKATWAADRADRIVSNAQDTVKAVEGKMAKAGDQKPVWEALKTELESTADGVKEAKDALTKAAADVTTAVGTLKEKLIPLKEAGESVAGGGITSEMTAEIAAAEAALDSAKESLAALEAKRQTMTKRESRLQVKLQDTMKKLS